VKLFRRLLNRKTRSGLDTGGDADPDTRRITVQSNSPLNKVLTRPALGQHGPESAVTQVDRERADFEPDIGDEDFNPYDSAAFDRASSWDRISRQKKR
jgi:hypothetical protein